MDKNDIFNIISKIEKEKGIFSQKAYLDPLASPEKIIGRTREAEDLVRLVLSYKQGFVVPFVSIYGRSGSGKSVTTRFVCENLDEISLAFVNLRQARTIFGIANLILGELGSAGLKSAQGINLAIDKIKDSIISRIATSSKKLFVLVLDEFDVIFLDKRNRPSDFVYKLVLLEEELRKNKILVCIITISNNVLAEYELDDRVKSRIGSSEIFFEPYSKQVIFNILKNRADVAFSKKVDSSVLEHCAELGSSEHGDARRAIDLLRVAAELASSKGEVLSSKHVDAASEELQRDRAEKVISKASYHFKLVCGSLACLVFLTGESWHPTSSIYKQYCSILQEGSKPLGYRRVSDLLVEVANTGLAQSQTISRGRRGYGTQYRLAIPPEMVGNAVSKEWWAGIEESKAIHDVSEQLSQSFGSKSRSIFGKGFGRRRKNQWG